MGVISSGVLARLAKVGLVVIVVNVALMGVVLPARSVFSQEHSASLSSLMLKVGEQGSVDLLAGNGTEPLGAWDMEISYDPEIVSVVGCRPKQTSLCDEQFEKDSVRVSGASVIGLTGDIILATLTFQCENVGESPLSLTLIVFGPAIGFPIPPQSNDGRIVCEEQDEMPTEANSASQTPQSFLPKSGVASPPSNRHQQWVIASLAIFGLIMISGLMAVHVLKRRALERER